MGTSESLPRLVSATRQATSPKKGQSTAAINPLLAQLVLIAIANIDAAQRDPTVIDGSGNGVGQGASSNVKTGVRILF